MVPHRMAVLAFTVVSAAPNPAALRGTKDTNSTAAQGAVLRSWGAGCCNGCHTAFCSPQSGSCYDYKGKYYYLECEEGSSPPPTFDGCCKSCQPSHYCSPQSGTCYESKAKDYYVECRPRPSARVENYACARSERSETFYGLASYKECQQKCLQFSWCQFFQFKDGTAEGCLDSSRRECEVLSTCDDVIDASCWDYYHG